MEGNVESEAEQGVIPRSVRAIFERLKTGKYAKSAVTVRGGLKSFARAHLHTCTRASRRRPHIPPLPSSPLPVSQDASIFAFVSHPVTYLSPQPL
jgi:hypothetical protein